MGQQSAWHWDRTYSGKCQFPSFYPHPLSSVIKLSWEWLFLCDSFICPLGLHTTWMGLRCILQVWAPLVQCDGKCILFTAVLITRHTHLNWWLKVTEPSLRLISFSLVVWLPFKTHWFETYVISSSYLTCKCAGWTAHSLLASSLIKLFFSMDCRARNFFAITTTEWVSGQWPLW